MKNLIYIILFLSIICSCTFETEEEISWELESHPDMLVVESIITNEYKEQAVKLTLSNSYFNSTEIRTVQNATVTIGDGLSLIHFYEKDELPGYYFSEIPFAGEELKTYDLTIELNEEVNGLSLYSASSKMPQGLEMDSVICEIYEMPEFEFSDDDEVEDSALLVIFYFGKEPPNSENYYFSKVFLNNELIAKNPKEYNSRYTTSENAGYTNVDAYQKNSSQDDTVRFRLFTIEKDYYKYLNAIRLIDEAGSQGSMAGPPANAVGNISEGKALGYFLTAFVSEKSSLAKDMR